MKLLVDIGNSALKWAVLEQGDLRAGAALPCEGDLLAALERALEREWGALPVPEEVLVADVGAGSAAQAVTRWCASRWGCEALRVEARARAHGVVSAYREPQRLGVDRWLGLVAARATGPGAALVVDCGSAVTVDVLDGEGQHLGGLIVPGLGLARRCLEQHTRVQVDEASPPEVSLLARDTAGAVRGGGLYALVAFVDRVAEDVQGALGTPLRQVITGGDAPAVLPLLHSAYEHRPHLVLEGLAQVAEGD